MIELPENLTPFLVPKSSEVDQFLDAPCPMCEAVGGLRPIARHEMLCTFKDKEEEIDVSGVICYECSEIFLDEKSLELYLNILFKLKGITYKRISLDSGQPVEQSIH